MYVCVCIYIYIYTYLYIQTQMLCLSAAGKSSQKSELYSFHVENLVAGWVSRMSTWICVTSVP